MNELMEEIVHNSGRCIKCNSRLFDNKLHLVCTNCGLVHGNTNIVTRNWGKYEEFNYLEPLGTCIDSPKRKRIYDKQGKELPAGARETYMRLKNRDKMLYYQDFDHQSRIFYIAERICSYLQLNNVIMRQILYLYKKLYRANKDKINKRKPLLLETCFYVVIKENDIPIHINEIIEAFRNNGHWGNKRLIIQMILLLKLNVKKYTKIENYIEKYLNGVANIKGLEERLKNKKFCLNKEQYLLKIRNIVYKISKMQAIREKGCQPNVMTGAIIYFAIRIIDKKFNGHYTISQDMLEDAIGVSSYSIREIYVHVFKKYLKKVSSK